jgi:class 3 adenylate cyclase
VAASEGPLILADISGYTAFVADTELEHSRAILNELLEMLVRAIARHVRIGQIEGDAVFGVAERMPPRPIEWLEECFVEYHRRLRDIQEITTCPCRACANVGSLSLKFVAHFGEYMAQRIGGVTTFVGRDVNIAHRLLKNSVPSHEYILATSAFLGRIPTTTRVGFVPHTERSDQAEVAAAYIDLTELRAQARSTSELRLVESDHASLTVRRTYDATHERLWQVLTDPKERARWMGWRIDYQPGARGTLLGGEYHCEHGLGTTIFRIVSTNPPDQLTTVARTTLGLVWETNRVREAGAGSVELERSYHWERAPGVRGRLVDALLRLTCRLSAVQAMNVIETMVNPKVTRTRV